MKKIIMLLLSLIITNVKALTPSIVYQPGIYGNKVSGSETFYGQLGYIYIDNKIAYCLEPYKLIGSNYNVDSSVKNNFTQADINYFTLLSYYGYNNTNHNSVYYYMATQELIWRRITGQEVYWTTENVTKGSRINIEIYKNEIVNAVNKHNLTLSFGNKNIKGKFRDTIVLEDTNNLLSYYTINNTTPNKVWKEANKLYIKIMSSKAQNITLTRTISNGSGNTYYSSSGSQAIGSFALNETKTITLNVQATNKYSMKLDVQFKDKNTKNLIKGKVKFKIKNLNSDTYLKEEEIFETDENGNYLSDFYVEEGNYQIEILEVPPNYLIETGKTFEIIEDPNVEILTVENFIEEAKGQIEIERIFDLTKLNKEKIKVANANYEIYAKEDIYDTDGKIIYNKDQLIETITTDETGKTFTSILPLGKYYIKEILNDEVITKEDKIYEVELKYKDQNTNLIIEQLKIETEPNILDLKLDIEEHKTKCIDDNCNKTVRKLENIEYGLYAKENITINNQIVIKKDELIRNLKTDKNGRIDEKISLLKGNYMIKEITDMSIYKEKFEDINFYFETDDIKDIKVIKTLFEKEITNLPNTINKNFKYYILIVITSLIGFIGLIHENKKD